MSEIRYTLVSDGSSDAALVPILDWLLIQNGISHPIRSNWADLRRCPPINTLKERVRKSLDLYPCDLLFIHRDAEREERNNRVMEVRGVIQELTDEITRLPYVCVIPVRMTEAWLLFDEQAIRHAAGNRNGRQAFLLPRLNQLEFISDPKAVLFDLIKKSSGLNGRRLKRFPVHRHAYRVSNLVADFSPLRSLSAFSSLETDVRNLIQSHNWHL